jgi:ABC-2 type transport system ATP-binding protein
MQAAITAERLGVTFAGGFRRPRVTALRDVSFAIAPGSITGILGPNGSGKTTLLRVLAGLQQPDAGEVAILGHPPGARELRTALAFQPEGPLPLGPLSAPEFLAYFGCLLRLPNAESDARASHWLDRLDLRHAGVRAVKTFSTGMQKRLALAAALLGEPKVLLLDEPTSGLDPMGSAAVMEILLERARAGTTVLLASHHLQEVEQLCTDVLVLQAGEVRARGTLDELLGRAERSLVVRGLDEHGLAALAATAQQLGGEVVRTERARDHLFALFRRFAAGGREPPPGASR